MATYCISDIHGHPKEFFGLLDKVSPASDDQVYVLGDIVDRGPGTVRMLEYAMGEAPESMHFLLGNHEDLLASFLRCSMEKGNVALIGRMFGSLNHPYLWNTDRATLRSVLGKKRRAWWDGEVLEWIENLPPYAVVEAGGRRWMLVHGGFNPRRWLNPGSRPQPLLENGLHEPGARSGNVDLAENGFGLQWVQTLIWAREDWLDWPGDSPLPVVCGHTPTQNDFVQQCVARVEGSRGSSGRICHIANRHVIDCGCGFHGRLKNWNLAAFRLDDGEEFYYRDL